jgi:hypothetical protein
MTQELKLPSTSRYRVTPVYSKAGCAFFGVWVRPNVKRDGDEKIITIGDENRGQLDLIAHEEYGDRSLWWAIASMNFIRSVSDEVVPGLRLVVPKLANIKSALLESGDGAHN